MKPRIYDHNMTFLGELRNASKVGYTRVHNDLYTATFRLPARDPKNALCDDLCIVDIFDGDVSMGKYRLLDEPETDISSSSSYITYNAEHVIAFLMNDVIDGYIELGDTNTDTEQVLRRLLAMQTTTRWQLGRCDFHYNFSYSWENTNLMSAVFSIPTCFSDAYQWTYDTDTSPWTLNLIKKDDSRSCEFRRKRNMRNVKRGRDRSSLCTRLYCKGSGEGVNQVGIAGVNPTGLPYIDADTKSRYGTLASHYIDLSITDPEVLYHKGLALLEQIKHPRYTYTVKAIDLCRMTGLSWDRFDEGKIVHLIDDELNLDFDTTIIQVSKPDVDGDPLDIDVVLSNKSSDVASSIDDLANRTAIMSQYSQGATNLYSQQFADNADADHPAIMRVYVPAEAFKINQMLLAFSVSPFRAYETGAASGGSMNVTSEGGGGMSVTSESGGGMSVTSEGGGGINFTSDSGGGMSVTSEGGGGMTITSEGGGGTTVSSSSGGATETTSASGGVGTVTASGWTLSASGVSTSPQNSDGESTITDTGYGIDMYGNLIVNTASVGAHVHSGPSHRHSFSGSTQLDWAHRHMTQTTFEPGDNTQGVYQYSAKTISMEGNTGYAGTGDTGEAGEHTHDVYHKHRFDHVHTVRVSVYVPGSTVEIPSHTHNISISAHEHQVTVPDHMHTVTLSEHMHTVTLGSHSHNITMNDHTHIVTVSSHMHNVTLSPHTHQVTIEAHTHNIVHGIYEGSTASKITLVVDGVTVPTSGSYASGLDIAAHLSKDSSGKIKRGTWHEIKLVPDKLTRIEANLFVKTFVTSHGGGNY